MNQKAESIEWKSLIKIFLVVGGGVLVIWISLGGLSEVFKECGKNVESITALFSGLAFAGMIVAIVLQGKELFLQRQELSETREQLRRTAEANETAAKLAQENIKAQEIIAQNNIAAQRLALIIDYYYKNVEFYYGRDAPIFEQHRKDIEKILDKFLELKGPHGPVISDTTIRFSKKSSTPEA